MSLINSIKIESVFFPPIVIDKPLESSPGGNPILEWLKPSITIDGDLGSNTAAPYGSPRYEPILFYAALSLLLVGGFFILRKLI